MPLRTPDEYKKSLRDDRTIYFKGERIKDVTQHPVLKTVVEHACLDFSMAEDPQYQDLATYKDPETGEVYSRYFHMPHSSDDLLKRSELIEVSTTLGATLVLLIKEIGTDALFALHLVAQQMDQKYETNYLERVKRFYQHCRENDLAMAVAQTDVKGDRSLGPSAQEHPDYYLRVVKEDNKGIVVRGAKVHTTVSVNSNEIIVLPTRSMNEQDKDYAVAFAIPTNTPGLKMIASPHGSAPKSESEHPISSKHLQVETLTIFDDVFVPWERVFMKGEWDFAGPLALTFVEYHRFTAVSYKLPLCDTLVGAAILMADYNGILRAGHVRDKITWLIAYAETVRGMIHMAAINCKIRDQGIAVPDPVLTNIAKFQFASNYFSAISHVIDISGGLLVTGPGQEDMENPELRKHIDRYLGGRKGISAEDRLKAINLVKDLTASDYAGWQKVLNIHAEGSIEAEKLTIFRGYDPKRAVNYAKQLANIIN